MKPLEKRKALRFRLKLPVKLKHGGGVTRDISATGVYIETDHSYSVGEPVEFAIGFSQAARLEHSFGVNFQGEVLRVDPGPQKFGVAVSLTLESFERGWGQPGV